MSKFKAGDHVRIKSEDEILRAPRDEAQDADYVFLSRHGLGFMEEMFRYCGTDVILTTESMWAPGRWNVEGRGADEYWWDEDWLEPYEDLSAVSNLNLEELL